MRLVLGSLLLISVTDYGESWVTIVNDSGEFFLFLLCVRYEEDSMRLILGSLLLITVTDYGESWLTIVNESSEFLRFLLCERYEEDSMRLILGIGQSSTQ
jgi:hypothetical protein